MSGQIHERVKSLFAEAIELAPEERKAFLDVACGDDPELRDQVDALVASHFPDSIVGKERRAEREPSVAGASTGAHLSAVLGGRWRRPVMVATALGLIALGLWTHARVEESLRRIREDELRTVLAADVAALEIWIREFKDQARTWAQDPRFPPLAAPLVALGQHDPPPGEALAAAPEREAIDAIRLELRDELAEVSFIGFLSREARLLYGGRYSTGIYLDKDVALGNLMRTFAGETVFFRPHRNESLVDSLPERLPADVVAAWRRSVYASVTTPLRNADGEIIAAFYVSKDARGSFTEILQVAQLGETGETYAFDSDGLMLSESRFIDDIRASGLLAKLTMTPTIDESAQVNLEVRDPGGELAAGFAPALEVGARPLTLAAALAIASRDADDPSRHQGTVTNPYRNYRGVDVIGAWRWLPEYGFGVVTEIEAVEAFAPLRYLEVTFGVLLVLLTGTLALSFASSLSVVRLRRRVKELAELGPYKLVKPIGKGGMGEVFLAEHALLKRPTAVKTLLLENLTEQNIARFEREVRLASQLEHPNTIEIYDFGRTPDNVLYYAMEYLDGVTLGELVARDGAQPPARVIHVLSQVCGSLEEAHEHGLIHRDIKPPNIMLCNKGGVYDVVKVLDFGLAKPIDESATRDLTGGLHVGGTPLYMAPERLDTPDEVDARADVYAVGAVAYYLLSAKPLFSHSGVKLLHHVMHSEPEPLSSLVSDHVPAELVTLVTRCLSKDPSARPQTATELRESLVSIVDLDIWGQKDARAWWESRERAISA